MTAVKDFVRISVRCMIKFRVVKEFVGIIVSYLIKL